MLRLSHLRDPSTYCQRNVYADFFPEIYEKTMRVGGAMRDEETAPNSSLHFIAMVTYYTGQFGSYFSCREKEREREGKRDRLAVAFAFRRYLAYTLHSSLFK